jgi:methoxymalonate biosynthesis acyl carrier protein
MTDLDRIREFIKSNLTVFDEGVSFGDDDNIFELGLVDSLFAVQLVLFIEGEFGVDILDSELYIDNFDSVNSCNGSGYGCCTGAWWQWLHRQLPGRASFQRGKTAGDL